MCAIRPVSGVSLARSKTVIRRRYLADTVNPAAGPLRRTVHALTRDKRRLRIAAQRPTFAWLKREARSIIEAARRRNLNRTENTVAVRPVASIVFAGTNAVVRCRHFADPIGAAAGALRRAVNAGAGLERRLRFATRLAAQAWLQHQTRSVVETARRRNLNRTQDTCAGRPFAAESVTHSAAVRQRRDDARPITTTTRAVRQNDSRRHELRQHKRRRNPDTTSLPTHHIPPR